MIPKADCDADATILAAATQGTWITAALPTRAASPEIRLGSFGPCVDTPRNMLVMVCIQAPGASFGDVAMTEATTSWEQHAANAKAAAHAVNRLPEYIADAAEMERRIDRIEAKAEEWRTKAIALHAAGEHAASDLARARLDSLTGAVRILRGGQ